jgi:hypothetical protein
MLLLILLTLPSCVDSKSKEKREVLKTVNAFIHRLDLRDVYCSISTSYGRCFGRTSSETPVYFVCDPEEERCILHDITAVPIKAEEERVGEKTWE